MRNAFSLFRILTQTAEMPRPKEGSRQRIYTSLAVIALSCIMLPCCGVVGYISYIMSYALLNVGAPTAGLQAEIHILSAFSMIFGFLVILNVLFFSSDREHLSALPIKSEDILFAKFAHSYAAESVMEILILISMFLGVLFAFLPVYGFRFFSFVSGILAVFLIPLLPLTYCAILCLILMACLRRVRNSRILNHISTIVFLAFTALFLLSFKDMGGITIENYVNSLADGTNLFNVFLDKFFFTVPLLLKAIEYNSILYLLLYLLANAAAVGIMLLLGKYLYQQGLYTVAALGNGKRHVQKTMRIRAGSAFHAYLKKEFLVLARTKAYMTNCLLINLLWPFATLLLFVLNRNKEGMQKLVFFFENGYQAAYVLFDIAVLSISFIACAMNSIAATGFTREGAHINLLKYIPLSYHRQLRAKAAVSFMITVPPLFLTLIFAVVGLHIPPYWLLYDTVLLLCAVTITTGLGLFLDSMHPHIAWEDEYSALRGNLNSFFDMALIMVIAIIIGGFGFLLHYFTKIGAGIHAYFAIVLLLGAIFSLLVFPKKIISNMKDIFA